MQYFMRYCIQSEPKFTILFYAVALFAPVAKHCNIPLKYLNILWKEMELPTVKRAVSSYLIFELFQSYILTQLSDGVSPQYSPRSKTYRELVLSNQSSSSLKKISRGSCNSFDFPPVLDV